MGKFLSASMRRNSCPTAPLAPTIATFIIVCVYVCPYSLSAFSFVCIGLRVATLCFTNILQRYNFSVYMQLFERIKSHFSTFRVLPACRSGRGRFRVSCRSFPAFSGFLGFRRAIYNKVWSKGCFRRFANKASLASKQDLFTMQRSLVWKPKKPCFFVDGFSCVMQAVLCRFFTSRRCTPLPRVRSWVGSSLPLPNGRGRAG